MKTCYYLLAILLTLYFPNSVVVGQSLSWLSVSGIPGCITVKKGADGKLFASSDGSEHFDGIVYYSTDDGQAWYSTSIAYGWIFEIITHQENVVVSRVLSSGRTPYQVFRSIDNGVSWKGILASDLGFSPFSGFMFSDTGKIYAVATFYSNFQQVVIGSALVKLNGQRWDFIGTDFVPTSFYPGTAYTPTPTFMLECCTL